MKTKTRNNHKTKEDENRELTIFILSIFFFAAGAFLGMISAIFLGVG